MVTDLARANEMLEFRISSAEATVEDQKEKMERQDQILQAQRMTIIALTKDKENLKHDLQLANERIKALESSTSEAASDAANPAHDDREDFKQQINELHRQLLVLQTERSHLQDRIGTLEADHKAATDATVSEEDYNKVCRDYTRRLQEFDRIKKSLEIKIKKYKANRKKAVEEKKRLMKENLELTSRLESVEAMGILGPGELLQPHLDEMED
jgi:predicted  nucleic acid-binding Zn-ribbon protein